MTRIGAEPAADSAGRTCRSGCQAWHENSEPAAHTPNIGYFVAHAAAVAATWSSVGPGAESLQLIVVFASWMLVYAPLSCRSLYWSASAKRPFESPFCAAIRALPNVG